MFVLAVQMPNDPVSNSFFFNDTATTEIYTLSLHDALPIWAIPPSAHVPETITRTIRAFWINRVTPGGSASTSTAAYSPINAPHSTIGPRSAATTRSSMGVAVACAARSRRLTSVRRSTSATTGPASARAAGRINVEMWDSKVVMRASSASAAGRDAPRPRHRRSARGEAWRTSSRDARSAGVAVARLALERRAATGAAPRSGSFRGPGPEDRSEDESDRPRREHHAQHQLEHEGLAAFITTL